MRRTFFSSSPPAHLRCVVGLSLPPAPRRLGALWNYKLSNGSSSTCRFSTDESLRNYKSHVQTLWLCVQGSRTEVLKDTVSLGRSARIGLGQRNGGDQTRVPARVSVLVYDQPREDSTWRTAHQNVCTAVTRGAVACVNTIEETGRWGPIFRRRHAAA